MFRVVPAAHAKPHAQQQIARHLEVDYENFLTNVRGPPDKYGLLTLVDISPATCFCTCPVRHCPKNENTIDTHILHHRMPSWAVQREDYAELRVHVMKVMYTRYPHDHAAYNQAANVVWRGVWKGRKVRCWLGEQLLFFWGDFSSCINP